MTIRTYDLEHVIANQNAQTSEEKWQVIRSVRDELLKDTDWTQLADVPEITRSAWQPYRRALRDLPESFNNPDEVVLPNAPT